MQIYMYNSDDFDSLGAALREKRIIAAMAVFFQVAIFFIRILLVDEEEGDGFGFTSKKYSDYRETT